MMSPAKALINFVPDKLCMQNPHSSHKLRANGMNEQIFMSAKILFFKYPDAADDIPGTEQTPGNTTNIKNVYFVSAHGIKSGYLKKNKHRETANKYFYRQKNTKHDMMGLTHNQSQSSSLHAIRVPGTEASGSRLPPTIVSSL